MRFALIVLAIALVACGAPQSGVVPHPVFFDSLTRADLDAYPGRTVYEAIRAQHGNWLVNEGGALQVWVGLVDAGPSELFQPASNLAGVRFLHANDAASRFGTRSTGPAIVLYPRAGR